MIWKGGAVIACDASTPPGLAERLVAHLRDEVPLHRLSPQPGELPLAALGAACGLTGASMAQFVASGQSFVIETQGMASNDLTRWSHCLSDFLAHFHRVEQAGAMLFLGAAKVPGLGTLDWGKRLRRVDAMIWAEFAVPSGRSEVMQRLAVDLAVELCGWRLDLVADLVSQREEDILDPMGWLHRNADAAIASPATFGAAPFLCPLHLLAKGDLVELRRRIWSAQLSVLFPWIEDQRQRLVERYRKQLYIDEHLRALGVFAVEDIELGGLRRQLSKVLARDETEQVAALANLRNDLAHRKPVKAVDFTLARRMKKDD